MLIAKWEEEFFFPSEREKWNWIGFHFLALEINWTRPAVIYVNKQHWYQIKFCISFRSNHVCQSNGKWSNCDMISSCVHNSKKSFIIPWMERTRRKNLNCFLMKQRQQMIQLDHSKTQIAIFERFGMDQQPANTTSECHCADPPTNEMPVMRNQSITWSTFVVVFGFFSTSISLFVETIGCFDAVFCDQYQFFFSWFFIGEILIMML